MKKKIVGYYHFLAMYPDVMSKMACYGKRIHKRLGLQVKIKSLGELRWININAHDFTYET